MLRSDGRELRFLVEAGTMNCALSRRRCGSRDHLLLPRVLSFPGRARAREPCARRPPSLLHHQSQSPASRSDATHSVPAHVTMAGDPPPPPPREERTLLTPLTPAKRCGWGSRTLHSLHSTNAIWSIYAINAVGSAVGINALFSAVVINALFSLASMNAVASVFSVNSVGSAFSTDCVFCLGCKGAAFCLGTAFGGAGK